MAETSKTNKQSAGRIKRSGNLPRYSPAEPFRKTVYLEDVRCFKGSNAFKLYPLTFLVGENSTGKSTALGCMQVIYSMLSDDFLSMRGQPVDFNAEPYNMGTFGEIVRRPDPKKDAFKIGVNLPGKGEDVNCFVTFSERTGGSEPIPTEVVWSLGDSVEIAFSALDEAKVDKQRSGAWSIDKSLKVEKKGEGKFIVKIRAFEILRYDLQNLLRQAVFYPRARDRSATDAEKELASVVAQCFGVPELAFELRARSIAPFRFKPKRSYEPVAEIADPQGGEIPVMLINLSESRPDEWKRIRSQLVEFGKASGLFQDIQIRRFGKSKGNPFQMHIKVNGVKSNMVDVGYGVSQVLPILVRMMRDRDTTFIIQNPEVHLHHRAHAELTSLMIKLGRQNNNTFVIETHSDFMIDRARIEIMKGKKGKVDPRDVGIIYLEQDKQGVAKVHNIGFDKDANMLNRPRGYRQFFQREGDRLLGFLKD